MTQTSDFDVLLMTLNQYGVVDTEVIDAVLNETSIQHFNAEEALIRIGEKPELFYVIRRGLIRYYYAANNGKVWNKVFFREGQFSGSLNALITDGPCRYNVEAIEDTEVYALPLDLIHRNLGLHQQLQQLKIRLTEEMFLRNESREAFLLTCNAGARYQWLLENERWLVERVPQYHLASYLGMDAVSFSRIKNKAVDSSCRGSNRLS
ncbi:MAG: Crp/Fnr family transcriptional regulator [Cellvibrionaceae bacterium]